MTRSPRSRSLGRFVVLALLIGSLAACSSDDGSVDDTIGGGSDGSADAGPAGPGVDDDIEIDLESFPVTVEHMFGTAVVEAPPQRVVALGLAEQDIALALGVTPVAMVGNPWSDDQRFPWVGDEYDLSEVTFLPMETTLASAEQIVALRPDLILATTASGDPSLYDQASGRGVPIIAPLTGPMKDTWQDMTREIGRALGRSERAEEVIAEVEGTIAAVRGDLPELEGRSFVMAAVQSSSKLRVVNRGTDTTAMLFRELGMVVPPALEAIENPNEVGATDLSTERLDLLDSDALFLSTVDDNRDRLEDQAAFQALHAVTTGAYLPYDNDEAFGLRAPSPLSIPHLLDRFRPTLETVAAAPPAEVG